MAGLAIGDLDLVIEREIPGDGKLRLRAGDVIYLRGTRVLGGVGGESL